MAIDAAKRRALLQMLPLADGTIGASDRRQFVSEIFREVLSIVQVGAKILAPVEIAKSWGQIYTDEGWTTPEDQINAGFPITIQPTTVANGIWEETIDFGEVFETAIISLAYSETLLDGNVTTTPTISYSEDNISYTDEVDTKQVFANDFRYVKINLEFEGDDRTSLVLVESLRVRIDVKTSTESGRVEVTANPTSVVYVTEFVGTAKPTVTAEGATPLICMTTSLSATGFDITVFDLDGLDASGAGIFVNWNAEGPVG